MGTSTPAGWYPDPDEAALIRFWNGSEWTADTAPYVVAAPGAPPPFELADDDSAESPSGDVTVIALSPSAGGTDGDDLAALMGIPDGSRRSGMRKRVLGAVFLLAVALAGGVGAYVVLDGDDNSAESAIEDVDATESTTTTTATTTTTTIPVVVLPELQGSTRAAAESVLLSLGLAAEFAESPDRSVEAGHVITTDPTAGASLAVGDTVLVTVAIESPPSCNDIVGQIAPRAYDDLVFADETEKQAAAWASQTGIMDGVSDSSFGATDSLTRNVAVTVLHRYLCSPAPDGDATFADVDPGSFFSTPIDWAVGAGVVDGEAVFFRPDDPVTRALWITMLWRSLGEPDGTVSFDFDDVPEGAFYRDALGWALSKNLVTGLIPEIFGPDLPLTRIDAAKALYLLEVTVDPLIEDV